MKNSYGGLVKKKLEMCKYGVDCIHPNNCKYCHSNRELEEAKEASQKDGLNRNRKIHMCSHIMANRACPMKTAKECAFSHSVKEQEDALAREASQKDGLNRNRKIYMCKHIQANRACPMNSSENCAFAHSITELDEARTRMDKIGSLLTGLRMLGHSEEASLKAIQETGATSMDELWSYYKNSACVLSSDPTSSQSKAKKPTSSSINSAWNASLPERQRKEEERKAFERQATIGYEKKEKELEQKNASAEHSHESIVPIARMCQNIKNCGSCRLIGCIFAHSEEELNSRHSSLKKTQLCSYFSEGKLCPNSIKGECWFAHGEHERRPVSQIPPRTPSPMRLSPTFTPCTGGRMPPLSLESVETPWNQNEKLIPSILGEREFPPLAKLHTHGEHELRPVGQHDLPRPPSPNFTLFTKSRIPLHSRALKSVETPWNQNVKLKSSGESSEFNPLGSMLWPSLEMKEDLIDITNMIDFTNSEPLQQQLDTSEFQTNATNQEMGFCCAGFSSEELPCLIPETNSHYVLEQFLKDANLELSSLFKDELGIVEPSEILKYNEEERKEFDANIAKLKLSERSRLRRHLEGLNSQQNGEEVPCLIPGNYTLVQFLKDANLSRHFSLFKDDLGIVEPSEILEYNEEERKEFDANTAEILKLSERSRLRRHLECLKSQQNGCPDQAKKEPIDAHSCVELAGEEVPYLIPDNKNPQTNAAEIFLGGTHQTKKEHIAAPAVKLVEVLESVLQPPSNTETIGELTIYKTKILGQGLGVNVFEGECRHKGPVAVKVITTRAHPNLEHAAEIEAKILRKFLESADYHDNVVRYIHYEENKKIDQIYLAIELCTCSLYQVVEKKLPLLRVDLTSKCSDAHEHLLHQREKVFEGEIGPGNWFGQLVGGIEFIHSKEVVHGDLRPHNILIKVSETGVMLKITDFGLSREVREKGDWTWSRDAAPGGGNWYAPEVMLPKGQKPRKTLAVDIFSLGCVFYYIITGEHPSFNFHDVNLGNINALPEAVHLIGWMLRKWPEHRPTVTEIKRHPFLMELQIKLKRS